MKKSTYAIIVSIIVLLALLLTNSYFGLTYVIIEGFVLVFYALAIIRWKIYEIELLLKK